MTHHRACAAVVLYEPSAHLMQRLLSGIAGYRLMAIANCELAPDIRSKLAAAGTRIFESPLNRGLGWGLNLAVSMAAEEGFSQVLLLDQDSEPQVGLIEALQAGFDDLSASGVRAGIVAPLTVPPPEGHFRPVKYFWRARSDAGGRYRAAHFAPTSGSLVSLEAFADAGSFREDFFIAGIDVEWGFRAWSSAWGTYIATGLTMVHRWGEEASAEQPDTPQILRQAPARNYYYARNAVVTACLPHVPWNWRTLSCARLAAQMAVLAVRGGAGSLHAASSGLRDGMRGRLGPAPEEFA